MEDFPTRTYGTSGLDNRPLFGETSAKVSADRDSGLGVCVCVSDSALPLRVLGPLRPPKALIERKLVLQPGFHLRMFPCHSAPSLGQGWPRSLKAGGGEKFRKF